MDQDTDLFRPTTFEAGREYLWIERQGNGREKVMIPVRFAAYDACPAFVIVHTALGRKWRCPRDALFTGEFSLSS